MREIILILILQLCYVPMLALRTICMVKKLTLLTAFFGFLEAIVYVFGLALVLSGDQTTLAMVVYALGFSLGLIVGIAIENKIAIGFRSVQVNIKTKNMHLIDGLRSMGYGVTIIEGEGREGLRYRLDILTKRSSEKELFDIINEYEPNAFVIAYEPIRFKGGYIEQMMKHPVNPKKNLSMPKIESSNHGWFKKAASSVAQEVKELVKYDDEKEH
ncbi:MAG: DUF2179 domain-containing protein [Erysipelotrichaceae bacterium]|nr:DUF2179 domain-containing protein [Erysipelotrichaceae bacterium]MDP3305334.1 DUF2179 domain-containing protein [Erysipelotrichaceae bacterium]